MAFTFFGVYFQDINGVEYRCGFQDDEPLYDYIGTQVQ